MDKIHKHCLVEIYSAIAVRGLNGWVSLPRPELKLVYQKLSNDGLIYLDENDRCAALTAKGRELAISISNEVNSK